MKREVWVFAQRENKKIAEISLELLGKGRELADKLKVSSGCRPHREQDRRTRPDAYRPRSR